MGRSTLERRETILVCPPGTGHVEPVPGGVRTSLSFVPCAAALTAQGGERLAQGMAHDFRYGLPCPRGHSFGAASCMIRSGTDSRDKAGVLSARLRQYGKEKLAVDFDRCRDGLGRLLHGHHVLREEQDAVPDVRPPNVAMRAMRPNGQTPVSERRPPRRP